MNALIWVGFFVVVASLFYAGDALSANMNETEFQNLTHNKLVWNDTYLASVKDEVDNTTLISSMDLQESRIENVLIATIDWLGYTFFEISKWALEWGYYHQSYDYKALLNIAKVLLIVVIIVALLPALPVILALIYLAYKAIKRLFTYIPISRLTKR